MIEYYTKRGSRGLAAAEQAIPGDLWKQVQVRYPKTADIPRHCDFVLHCGTGTPTSKHEWFAATRGGFVACLPQADDFLAGRVRDAHTGNENLVLLDAALITGDVVA